MPVTHHLEGKNCLIYHPGHLGADRSSGTGHMPPLAGGISNLQEIDENLDPDWKTGADVNWRLVNLQARSQTVEIKFIFMKNLVDNNKIREYRVSVFRKTKCVNHIEGN